MRPLSRRASFGTASLVAALALWTSGAPSVVYPSYAAVWGVTPAVSTGVFAVYPLALVVVLGLFGGVSDAIGRRRAIVAGLAFMAAGTLLFAVAPAVGWIFTGRALTGIGVGLSLSPATAALVEFSAAGRAAFAGSVATAATAGGLTVATLLGGLLVQHAPDPLHLSFWVLLAVLLAAIVLALRLPRSEGGATVRPALPRLPSALRPTVIRAALAVAAAYALGAVVLSLGADIAVDLVRTRDAFVVGAVIAVSSAVIGLTALVTRGLRPALMVRLGALALVLGVGALVGAGESGSLALLLVAMVVAGAGYSLLFAGGLSIAGRRAPAEHRAATISVVYLASYAVQGATAVAIGQVATAIGLLPALTIGAAVLTVLGVAAAAATLRSPAALRADLEGSRP